MVDLLALTPDRRRMARLWSAHARMVLCWPWISQGRWLSLTRALGYRA